MPNTAVQILVGGTVIETVLLDENGSFSTTLRFTGPGVQYISCQRLDEGGNIAEARIPAYSKATCGLSVPGNGK